MKYLFCSRLAPTIPRYVFTWANETQRSMVQLAAIHVATEPGKSAPHPAQKTQGHIAV